MMRERLAEALARDDVRLAHLERAIGPAQPAHAVRESRRNQPRLREPEAVADVAEDRVLLHAHAVEAQLGLAVLEDGRAHHRHVAHVLDALGVAVDDEHRRAARADPPTCAPSR